LSPEGHLQSRHSANCCLGCRRGRYCRTLTHSSISTLACNHQCCSAYHFRNLLIKEINEISPIASSRLHTDHGYACPLFDETRPPSSIDAQRLLQVRKRGTRWANYDVLTLSRREIMFLVYNSMAYRPWTTSFFLFLFLFYIFPCETSF
jgi:hypothetical protein